MNQFAIESLFLKAIEAGRRAGYNCAPTPMVITSAGGVIMERVEGGVCGFAWVGGIKGNTSFGRWLLKEKLAITSYKGGLRLWISEFGQSMDRKMTMACEVARVLNEHGVDCYPESQID